MWLAEGGARGRGSTRSRHGERPAVLTHRRSARRAPRSATLIEVARARRVDAALRRGRDGQHGLERAAAHRARRRSWSTTSTSASSLGGDGTILTALRHYAGTGVPVFAVNFGEVGFLATVDPDGLEEDFARAFAATSRR